jgi:hypothetical protein
LIQQHIQPWLKPLTENVSYVVVELLKEMLRLGPDQRSMRAPVGYGQGGRRWLQISSVSGQKVENKRDLIAYLFNIFNHHIGEH